MGPEMSLREKFIKVKGDTYLNVCTVQGEDDSVGQSWSNWMPKPRGPKAKNLSTRENGKAQWAETGYWILESFFYKTLAHFHLF